MPGFDPNLAHSGTDRLQNLESFLEKNMANTYGPNDHGFAAWTYDPVSAGTPVAGGAGFSYFLAINIPYAMPVSTVWFNVASAASTVTSGQNFVALYQKTGATAASVASTSADTVFTSTGAVSASFTQLTLSPGTYYVSLMLNAGTMPSLFCTYFVTNLYPNLATANLRSFTNTSGHTTSIPASITLSSNAATVPYWAALS